MTIRIVTDSACDLPQDVCDRLGIVVVPLSIRFGNEEFTDRTGITVDEFWSRCHSSSVLPETAAPAPGQFEAAYRQLKADGASGICVINLSGELSATMQSAELAAKSVAADIPITVVDSRTVSMGQGLVVLDCAERAKAGASLDEVASLARGYADKVHVWGALDTLENLKKGGRIGGAKALMATALAIKPIIEIRNGKVEEGGRQRTRSKALAFLIDQVRSTPNIVQLGVLHAKCPDVDQFVSMLKEVYSGDIVVGDIGAVVGSHAGVGTIGVAFRVAN